MLHNSMAFSIVPVGHVSWSLLLFKWSPVVVLRDISAAEQLGSVNGCGKVIVAAGPAQSPL